MGVVTWFENEFQISEAWVLGIIAKAEAEIPIVEADWNSCWSWIGAHMNDITKTVTAIVGVVGELYPAGTTIPPAVVTGISAMTDAVSTLNAMVNSKAAGQNAAQVLVSGYLAAKGAISATANAASAVASNVPAMVGNPAPAPVASAPPVVAPASPLAGTAPAAGA